MRGLYMYMSHERRGYDTMVATNEPTYSIPTTTFERLLIHTKAY